MKSKCLGLAAFFIMLFAINRVHSQNSQKLLIYSSGGDNFVPYIESVLRELRDTINGSARFNLVNNLNRLNLVKSSEVYLRDVVDYYSGRKYLAENRDVDSAKTYVGRELLANDMFLQIKVNAISDMAEYQLFLYSINDTINIGVNNPSFQIGRFLIPIATDNFVVDFRSSELKKLIKNAIGRLFPNTNFRPVARIILNNDEKINSKTFANNEIITFDGTQSIDKDNFISDLNFKWRVISSPGKESYLLKSDETANGFKILPQQSGYYKVGLVVSDGIASVEEQTIEISVFDRLRIGVFPEDVFYVYKSYPKYRKLFFSNFIIYDSLSRPIVYDSISIKNTGIRLSNREKLSKLFTEVYYKKPEALSSSAIPFSFTTKDTIGVLALNVKFAKRLFVDTLSLSLYNKNIKSNNIVIPIRNVRHATFGLESGYLSFDGDSLVYPKDSLRKNFPYMGLTCKIPFISNYYLNFTWGSSLSNRDSIDMGFLSICADFTLTFNESKKVYNFFGLGIGVRYFYFSESNSTSRSDWNPALNLNGELGFGFLLKKYHFETKFIGSYGKPLRPKNSNSKFWMAGWSIGIPI